jgi:hypothetical protein
MAFLLFAFCSTRCSLATYGPRSFKTVADFLTPIPFVQMPISVSAASPY